MAPQPNGVGQRTRWYLKCSPLRIQPYLTYLNRAYLDNFLTKPGPLADESFVPGQDTIDAVEAAKILFVDAATPNYLPANFDP